MVAILSESYVCDGFDVRVRPDDGTPYTLHFLTRPADLEAAIAPLAAERAAQAAAEAADYTIEET
jgi:hypothetical protein